MPRFPLSKRASHQYVIAACFMTGYVQEFRHTFTHDGVKSGALAVAIKELRGKTRRLKRLNDRRDVRSEPITMINTKLVNLYFILNPFSNS